MFCSFDYCLDCEFQFELSSLEVVVEQAVKKIIEVINVIANLMILDMDECSYFCSFF